MEMGIKLKYEINKCMHKKGTKKRAKQMTTKADAMSRPREVFK